jgi:hypothetical protein
VALLTDIIRSRIKISLADAFLAARITKRDIPTSTLYFSDPLADQIGGKLDRRGRPIRREGPTLFSCGDALIIIRYLNLKQLEMLDQRRFARVYLVVDDDLFALHEHDGLPSDYRRRLIHYRDGVMRRLLHHVTHVVAPSEKILAHYPSKRQILLEPAQCHFAGGLAHHRAGGGLEVVFAGTRSHLEDLGFIAEDLAAFFRARPDARLTTFLNGHAPKPLWNLANALHLPVMSWGRYRAFVAQNRFHAAIAPALDTDFNRARSLSKLHDHAAYGAAGLYSRQPPFSNFVNDGVSGLLLANDPTHWRRALMRLANERQETERLAAEGQTLSKRLGDMVRVRNFWMSELGLP